MLVEAWKRPCLAEKRFRAMVEREVVREDLTVSHDRQHFLRTCTQKRRPIQNSKSGTK